MTQELLCECDRWHFYVTHYHETFYWHDKAKRWYVGWINLAEQDGFTQVSRYAIPMSYCPLCGGLLQEPED